RITRLLAVVAATVLVAATASGVSIVAPAASLDGLERWALRLGGAVAAAGGLLLLLRWRRRVGRIGRSDPAVSAVAAAATIMGTLALLALLAPRPPAPPNAEESAGIASLEQAPEEPSRPRRPEQFRAQNPRRNNTLPATGEDDSPGGRAFGNAVRRPGYASASDPAPPDLRSRLLLLGILLGIGALFGLFVVWRRMRRNVVDVESELPISAAEAEAGLASSLEEVAYEGSDPRGQVTAAYHRLLAALAEADAPRLPQEAPHEHLHRVLGPLGVAAAPMHTLAELYVIAQFSTRPVTDAHRVAAAEALGSALASLREGPERSAQGKAA